MIAADGMQCGRPSKAYLLTTLFASSADPVLQGLREYVRIPISLRGDTLTLRVVVFISEITARAFIIADSNKRRTLSRADIAKALSKSDQFDFLIDIVPRDDLPFPGGGASSSNANGAGAAAGAPRKNANIAAPKAANQVRVQVDLVLGLWLKCVFGLDTVV
jgi:hypothetical protein